MVTAELMFKLNNGQEIELFGAEAKLFLSHIISYKKEGEMTIDIDFVSGKMRFKINDFKLPDNP